MSDNESGKSVSRRTLLGTTAVAAVWASRAARR